LISILLILSSCRNLGENGLFGRRSLKKALLWAQQDSVRVADSLNSTLIVRDPPEAALQESNDLAEEEMLSGEGVRNQYYIIIGTFEKPENATQLSLEFRSKGYQTSIIKRTDSYGNNLDMVSIKTFNDYEEAISYLPEFQGKVHSSAWVYQSK
jgi:hypothetical protein